MKLPKPPKFALPAIQLAARTLPFTVEKNLAQQVLKRVFFEALTDGDLDYLEGRTVAIEITDINHRVTLTLNNNQLSLIPSEHFCDALIKGKLEDFICLASRSEDPDTLFFQRRLSMEGDTELGLETKNLLDSIEFSPIPQWLQKGLQKSIDWIRPQRRTTRTT